jgi:hypothetical protein
MVARKPRACLARVLAIGPASVLAIGPASVLAIGPASVLAIGPASVVLSASVSAGGDFPIVSTKRNYLDGRTVVHQPEPSITRSA